MNAKDEKPKGIKPWDPRPWPVQGHPILDDVYSAVGRALSDWERYEGSLSLLFATLTSTSSSLPARRAYNSVRTFEARIEMLRAASLAYFERHPDKDREDLMGTVISEGKCYCPRRHEIAHGVVDHFQPFPPKLPRDLTNEFALYPSFANFEQRDMEEMPTYCYAKAELDYFAGEFRSIIWAPMQLRFLIDGLNDRHLSAE
jgi:hypothetical protein